MCTPVCVRAYMRFISCVTSYDCTLEGKAGAAVEEDAAVPRPFACLVNIMTTAAP